MNGEDFNPIVSIIINNYNYGHFLYEAIESALSQTYSHLEIIVVDDGSTDRSPEVIASYKDQVIPVLKENGGQASAFNSGFAASQGDIICLLDSDDVFLPDKVANVVKVFSHNQDIDWCFHRLRFVSVQTGELIQLSRESGSRICDFRNSLVKGNLSFFPPATSGLCFKRSLLEKILPMPEAIAITSDNYLKFAAVGLSKGYFLDEQLALLRIHSENNYTLSQKNQSTKVKVQILTAYYLCDKWPSFKKFGNKMFARGLATYWKLGILEDKYKEKVKQYLSDSTVGEKSKILLRSLYYYISQ